MAIFLPVHSSIDATFQEQIHGAHRKADESARINEEAIKKVCITEEVHSAHEVSFVGKLCFSIKSTKC